VSSEVGINVNTILLQVVEPYTVAVSELTESHAEKLTPARKVFYSVISRVLFNNERELFVGKCSII